MELVSDMLYLGKSCLDIVCVGPASHGSGQCHAVSEQKLFVCYVQGKVVCLNVTCLDTASHGTGQCYVVSEEKVFGYCLLGPNRSWKWSVSCCV